MRVIVDARESGSSTGRYVDRLLQNLFDVDKDNEYILLLKNHRLNDYSKIPSNFRALECNIKEFTFAEQTKLLWQIRKLRPDLVHFPMVQHPVLYFGKTVIGMLDLTTLRYKNPTKNPVVFWIKQKVYWFVNWVASKKAKQIITISDFVKQDIIKNFSIRPSKITVTLNAADELAGNTEVYKELVGQEFIMYVGRHQPHKNLERLIEAHQKLLERFPDHKLVIVGKEDALTESLKSRVVNRKYINIMFTGFVPDSQLRWLYENTACYVFPSLSEGFGLPGLEAMIHGAPVASSDATCLPEIYGDAAHYFDPLDVDDMTNKISEVLSSDKLREQLIAKGYIQAKKYSWRRMAKQTLEVYQSVLKTD